MVQDEQLPGIFRELILAQLGHLRQVEERIDELERQIEAWHRQDKSSQCLAAIPGVGVITATAMVASIGDARYFQNSRHLAAWLGLVPRQESSGGKVKLLGISKRGDVYLRKLLIHGARSVLRVAEQRPGADRAWHVQVLRRRNKNIAAVALAHKNARTIWALLAKDRVYDPWHSLPAAA
jgi:transposase